MKTSKHTTTSTIELILYNQPSQLHTVACIDNMAPYKARLATEDAKIEFQSAKERHSNTNPDMSTIKGRKTGHSVGTSNLRDVAPGVDSQGFSMDTLIGVNDLARCSLGEDEQ